VRRATLAWGAATAAATAFAAVRLTQTWRDGQPASAVPADPVTVAQPTTLPTTRPGNSIRCAVIGGMTFTGFWQALAKRYEQQTGVHVALASSGEKDEIDGAFRRGGIDVITMHASDTIINLVADGYATDPQPWLRNDMVIVGPKGDPAGIRGSTDAVGAVRRIVAAHAELVVSSSLGTQEVLRHLCNAGTVTLDPAHTTLLLNDPQRQVLKVAADHGAYCVVGRVPFRAGRIPSYASEVMVEGDPALRRPFVVAIANPARVPGVHAQAAHRFAAWLRSQDTQSWVATYGRGVVDDQPLFFPVALP
jgi:tungstate transport system substrate-binding protein